MVCVVAVFHHVPLIGVLRLHLIGAYGVFSKIGLCQRMQGVGAGNGNFRDRVEPVAILNLHPCTHVLGRRRVASHQIPTACGAHIDIIIISIEVGSAESMEHLVTEGTAAEIV